jgi:hypothetical protein
MRDEGKVTGDELANRRLGKRHEARGNRHEAIGTKDSILLKKNREQNGFIQLCSLFYFKQAFPSCLVPLD